MSQHSNHGKMINTIITRKLKLQKDHLNVQVYSSNGQFNSVRGGLFS